MRQKCHGPATVLHGTSEIGICIIYAFIFIVIDNCCSGSTPLTDASNYSTAGDVVAATDSITSPAEKSVPDRSAVDVYADLRQTSDDVDDDESTGTVARRWHRWRQPVDKTASLDVGLGRTGSIRSTGTDTRYELGSFRSSDFTGTDRSMAVDGHRSRSGMADEDGAGKSDGDTLFRSARDDYDVNATYVVEEEHEVTQQEHRRLLESDDEDGERWCEVKLRGCPACWIKLHIEVRKRTANSSMNEAVELVDKHDDAKASLFSDSTRDGSIRGDSVRGGSDRVSDEEDWDDFIPIMFNCELCVDSVLIYEPAYGTDDSATSLSLVSEDMDLLTSSSTLDGDDVTGQWNYTSTTSSLIVKLSSTVMTYRLSSEVLSSQCPRVISVLFEVIEARRSYLGHSGQTIEFESPRFPFGYATGNGDTVTYIFTHETEAEITGDVASESHGYLSVTFDDWNLTAGTCIDMCDREEVTDCMVVQRFCWNDRRPVFETTSKSLYVAFSTSVDDPSPMATASVTSSTSPEVVIGFRATVHFRDINNRTQDACPPTYTGNRVPIGACK